jgi:chemotaxis methyl-accepting protein methylase
MEARDFSRLLDRFALSAEGYLRVRRGVQKRIIRHMQELQCPSMKVYLERLDADKDAERHARRLMDVSVSRFFRDGPLWLALEKEILPSLIRESPGAVRAWSAGCALGQEAYSFALLWSMLEDAAAARTSLEIWATDVNPFYMEKAIEGIYPARALAGVPANEKARFFSPAGKNSFRVSDKLREGVLWRIHDLAADAPPAQDFHVVLLRNSLLTYYRKETIDAVLPKIAGCLRPGGFFAVGRKERLPDVIAGFVPHPFVPYLYRKSDSIHARSDR